MNDLVSGDMSPASLETAMKYAVELSKSDMIPKE
jgi:hypothetical protein